MTDEEFRKEVDERAGAQVLLGDPGFRAAVRKLIEDDRDERDRLRLDDCADAQILAELEREWDRNNPPNAFGVYESIKADNPKAWVSPEVSLRMFAMVEHLARTALNEATRA